MATTTVETERNAAAVHAAAAIANGVAVGVQLPSNETGV